MKRLEIIIFLFYKMSVWDFVVKTIKEVEEEREIERKNMVRRLIISWVICLGVGVVIGYYIK